MKLFDGFEIQEETAALAAQAEREAAEVFAAIDETAAFNTAKVLAAYRKHRVSDAMMAPTTGYGYDDLGRDTMDAVFADVFRAEKALVRMSFANGTHAITCALFAAVRPGDKLLYVTGTPYDTIHSAIGLGGEQTGSLRYYGVDYGEVALTAEGRPDIENIKRAAADPRVKEAVIQRSRGYAMRPAMTMEDIRAVCAAVRSVNPAAAVVVDNCYGEFVCREEPLEAGADLIAGSLIKNPGAGLVPTGGYVAGRADLVDAAAARLTSPGIGGEVGSYAAGYRLLYQGLFMAPHTVAQALKTAVFGARLMELLGYTTLPAAFARRSDIVQSISFGAAEKLEAFCRGIQAGSPVDAYVAPVPGDMPGYDDPVIMAAGTFVQGSSIELSCDGPLRPPFTAYMQGGLTYESGRLGVLLAADMLTRT